jgi:hypothetical protein
MHTRHDPYCEDSAQLGEAFPDLIGGAVGLAFGLLRGSAVNARRLLENAIWMDGGHSCSCGCRCGVVHRIVVHDCGPTYHSGCSCC